MRETSTKSNEDPKTSKCKEEHAIKQLNNNKSPGIQK